MMKAHSYDPWPAFSYDEFLASEHLLHMGLQAVGKLKLMTAFEPQWANVILHLTSQGLTTGPVPYESGVFSVDVDFIHHRVICSTSWGHTGGFKWTSMSVAQFTKILFDTLHGMKINVTVDPKPQEVSDPILFDQDTEVRDYNPQLINAWWRILLSSYCVMEKYHARFIGKTSPVGLMWGTLDLRDVRSNLKPVSIAPPNTDYLRRNAMNEEQIEVGWWAGNPNYPRPAYFSFTFPQPKGVDSAKINPAAAHWEPKLGEFILDYDDVRKSKTPEKDLLAFFESTYQAGSKLADWDPKLIGSGEPV